MSPSGSQAAAHGRRLGAMADPEQDATPYVDALLAYSELDPGRFQVPGHKGGPGADPAMLELVGEAGLRNDIPSITEGVDIGPEPTPFQQAQLLAAEAWGARRSWFLVNGASQGNHATCMALAHMGGERGRPAQRPLLGDRRPGPERDAADLRRARARPGAGDRPRAHPGLAGSGARRDPGRGRGDGRLPHLLRRLRRRRGAGRGRPLARRAAGRRRGLGRPPALPPRAAARRARRRRRPGHLLDPQDRRQPDPGGDAPPRPRRPDRRRDRRPLRQPGRNDQPQRPAHRLARRRPAPGRGPRRGAARRDAGGARARPARRSTRSPASTCSTSAMVGRPGIAGWDPLRLGDRRPRHRLRRLPARESRLLRRRPRPRALLRERRRRDLRPRRAGGARPASAWSRGCATAVAQLEARPAPPTRS